MRKGSERRQHPRARVAATASVMREREKLGDYLVENVSAGGALITLGPVLPEGTRIRMSLKLRGRRPIGAEAAVVRHAALPGGRPGFGVEFRNLPADLQDALQRAVLRELEAAAEPTVLVVGEPSALVVSLIRDVHEAGRSVLYASTPLEAIGLVEVAAAEVQTLVCVANGSAERAEAVLDVLGAGMPQARRVLIGGPPGPNREGLSVPWERAALTDAVAPA